MMDRARHALNERNSRQRARLLAISYYSGGTNDCACCGESSIEFLAIDHVNGGGNLHRKRGGVGGGAFCRILKTQGFPDGFRVLCHNCNYAYGAFGACPHALGRGVCK